MEKGAGWGGVGGGGRSPANSRHISGPWRERSDHRKCVCCSQAKGEGVGAILLGSSRYRTTETGISFGRVGLTTCMRLNLTYRTLKLPYLDKSLK